MKKGLICALLVAAIVTFTLVGCSDAGGPSTGSDFVGTWQQSGGGQTETVVFTTTSFSIYDAGILGTGTMDCSIKAVDTGAKHIKMAVTSTTGPYTAVSNGTVIYLLYSISGNTLYMGWSSSSYPSSATMGPFIKQ